MGPTHDDITAKSIAKAFKLKYGFRQRHIKYLKPIMVKKNLMMVEKDGQDA